MVLIGSFGSADQGYRGSVSLISHNHREIDRQLYCYKRAFQITDENRMNESERMDESSQKEMDRKQTNLETNMVASAPMSSVIALAPTNSERATSPVISEIAKAPISSNIAEEPIAVTASEIATVPTYSEIALAPTSSEKEIAPISSVIATAPLSSEIPTKDEVDVSIVTQDDISGLSKKRTTAKKYQLPLTKRIKKLKDTEEAKEDNDDLVEVILPTGKQQIGKIPEGSINLQHLKGRHEFRSS